MCKSVQRENALEVDLNNLAEGCGEVGWVRSMKWRAWELKNAKSFVIPVSGHDPPLFFLGPSRRKDKVRVRSYPVSDTSARLQ